MDEKVFLRLLVLLLLPADDDDDEVMFRWWRGSRMQVVTWGVDAFGGRLGDFLADGKQACYKKKMARRGPIQTLYIVYRVQSRGKQGKSRVVY